MIGLFTEPLTFDDDSVQNNHTVRLELAPTDRASRMNHVGEKVQHVECMYGRCNARKQQPDKGTHSINEFEHMGICTRCQSYTVHIKESFLKIKKFGVHQDIQDIMTGTPVFVPFRNGNDSRKEAQ